ncbi:MAG: hypothetical protein HYX66_02135 [Ignavibacteria bacterium]|nr:hypothetical protein [Ignavibacteria bacterium]
MFFTLRIFLFAQAMMFVSFAVASAQTIGTRPGPMQYPEALAPYNFKTALEMAFLKMPEAVVEESDTYRWPAWALDVFMGLPENIVAEGKITTQFINWHFQLGTKWQWSPVENVRTYVGVDYAYFMGGIGSGTFDNSNRSSFAYVNVSVGYHFNKITLTLKEELNYLLSRKDRAGDITIRSFTNKFNGVTTSLYLEQEFWKDQQFLIGIRANYLKFVYQNWLLFPVSEVYYFVPEFVLGIRL